MNICLITQYLTKKGTTYWYVQHHQCLSISSCWVKEARRTGVLVWLHLLRILASASALIISGNKSWLPGNGGGGRNGITKGLRTLGTARNTQFLAGHDGFTCAYKCQTHPVVHFKLSAVYCSSVIVQEIWNKTNNSGGSKNKNSIIFCFITQSLCSFSKNENYIFLPNIHLLPALSLFPSAVFLFILAFWNIMNHSFNFWWFSAAWKLYARGREWGSSQVNFIIGWSSRDPGFIGGLLISCSARHFSQTCLSP